MRITKSQLKQIIKEELASVLKEAPVRFEPTEIGFHTVREGDTLWDLYKNERWKFGDSTIEDVISHNNAIARRSGDPPMDPRNLKVGSEIIFPHSSDTAPSARLDTALRDLSVP